MISHHQKHLVNTQPQHDSLFSQSRSSFQPFSEGLIKRSQHNHSHSHLKIINSNDKDAANEHSVLSLNEIQAKKMEIVRMRRKYRCSHSYKKEMQPQLSSPFIGLKVRRAGQNDHKFHADYTKDEVLNFFTVTKSNLSIKRKVARQGDHQPIRREKYRQKQEKQHYFQPNQENEERASSQLSGWDTKSNIQKQSSSAFQGASYQIISNFPSISVGITNKQSQQNVLSSQNSYPETDQPQSGFELPQFSIKVIQPSQAASINDAISIRVIQDSSHPKIPAKPTSSSEKLYKKIYQRIHSNKQNSVIEEEVYSDRPKVEKAASRNMVSTGQTNKKESGKKILQENINSKVEIINQNDSIVNNQQTAFQSNRQISMKKTQNKALVEQIFRYNHDTDQKKSATYLPKNPWRQEKVGSPYEVIQQQMDGSILPLKTLNSRINYQTQRSPGQFRVHIRQATLMDTQCWPGIESSENNERMTTVHQPRTFGKDFSTQVRISLTKYSKKESFHSQEDLHFKSSEECASSQRDEPLHEVVAEEIDSMMEYMEDYIISDSKQKKANDIGLEVARNLDFMESDILQSITIS